MKIHRIYSESSKIEEMENDKVVITMSAEEFWWLESILDSVKMNWISKLDIEKAKLLYEEFSKTIETTEWAK